MTAADPIPAAQATTQTSVARNKLLSRPATFPWRLDSAHPSSLQCWGDVDGDGRDELIVVTAVATRPAPCLSVLGLAAWNDFAGGGGSQAQLLVQWSAPSGLPGWTIPQDAPPQAFANFTLVTADLEHRGSDDVIAFFPGSELGGQTFPPAIGVLRWSGSGLATLWQQQSTVPGAKGAAPWTLAAGNQLLRCDIDGDQHDEIVVIAPGAGMAVLKWVNGALVCLGQTGASIPAAGKGAAWPLTAGDQWAVGDVDGDANHAQEVVLIHPALIGDSMQPSPGLGVVKWQQGALACVAQIRTSFDGSPGDVGGVTQCWVEDVDHDGTAEIVLVSGGSTGLSVRRWNGGTLAVAWQAEGDTVPGYGGAGSWQINPGAPGFFPADGFYMADIDGDGRVEMVLNQAGDGGYGVLRWEGSGMACVAQAKPPVPGATGASAWPLTSGDQLYFASLDGKAGASAFVLNSASAAVLAWQGKGFVCLWSAQNAVPGWNLDFIANGPATAFTPFTGTQLQIYQQISAALDPPALGADFVTGDIRYQYANLTNAATFDGWASQIKDMQPLPGYTAADWQAVAPVIAAEAGWVGTNYGLVNDMTGLAQQIAKQQDQDLSHCMDNMGLDQITSPAPVGYWPGAVADAALWGLAALPLGPEIQIGLAVAASLFGSLIGQPTSGTPPQAPKQVQYMDFKATIDAFFNQAVAGAYLDLASVVTDPYKLALAGGLAEGPWFWRITDNATVASNGSVPNRLMFYQMLIPAQFSLFVWTGRDGPFPAHRWLDYANECNETPIPAPPHAFWWSLQGDGKFTVSLLAQGTISEGGGGVQLVAYPVQDLITDLFTTLQVLPADITNQRLGWDKLAPSDTNDSC